MSSFSKNKLRIILLIVLLVTLPLALFVVKQVQNLQQQAAEIPLTVPTPTPTPVTVNDPCPPFCPNSSTPTNVRALVFTTLLNGIGNGGDSQTPGRPGNFSPLHPVRPITVEFYEAPNSPPVNRTTASMTFNSTTGAFHGTIPLGTQIPDGSYLLRMKTPGFIKSLASGFITLDQTNTMTAIPVSTTTLVVGDSNDDNSLDILDYNIIADCFSIDLPARSCSNPERKLSADLNDDGKVDGVDINLLIRNARVRAGS